MIRGKVKDKEKGEEGLGSKVFRRRRRQGKKRASGRRVTAEGMGLLGDTGGRWGYRPTPFVFRAGAGEGGAFGSGKKREKGG